MNATEIFKVFYRRETAGLIKIKGETWQEFCLVNPDGEPIQLTKQLQDALNDTKDYFAAIDRASSIAAASNLSVQEFREEARPNLTTPAMRVVNRLSNQHK